MKTKKKIRLKKQAYFIFGGLLALFIITIVGINWIHEMEYHETYEYKLTEKGYNLDTVKQLLTKADESVINKLLEMDQNDLYANLILEKYYLNKNFDEYLTYYQKEKETELSDIVAIVNVHVNHKWYEITLDAKPELKELLNVNKFYTLNTDYIPETMEAISLDQSYGEEGENKLVKVAYEEFMNMWQAAKDAGYYLMVTSSYRNYEEQKEIYDYRKATLGERKADETAARPGNSEHQSGYVVDMTSKDAPTDEEFKDSAAYNWLKENAHLYGFIERYPENKTYLTGYSPESWHWRYVGIEAATKIYEEQITFDEYYAFYIEQN